MMKVVSLFSGCGGLDLGFSQAGFDVIWANEYDKTIWDTYELNHPQTPLNKFDIRAISSDSIPNCDGIIGGAPCQSWSVAGLGRGANDPRGKLFWEYIRILEQKQPTFFLAENVPGILSKKHQHSLSAILQLFDDAGYNISYQKLNCGHYGVPQDRERVFFVGYRKDLEKTFDFNNILKAELLTLWDAISDLQHSVAEWPDKSIVLNHEYVSGSYSSQFMSRQRVRKWHQQGFTIVASSRHVPLHPQANKMVQIGKDTWEFDSSSPEPYRRLSVRECARIQTFPDNFEFIYCTISHGYKMLGNAVPVRMAEAIARAIKSDLNC